MALESNTEAEKAVILALVSDIMDTVQDGFYRAKEVTQGKDRALLDAAEIFGSAARVATMQIPEFRGIPGKGVKWMFGAMSLYASRLIQGADDATLRTIVAKVRDAVVSIELARDSEPEHVTEG